MFNKIKYSEFQLYSIFFNVTKTKIVFKGKLCYNYKEKERTGYNDRTS